MLGNVDESAWALAPGEAVHVVGDLFARERVYFVFCSSNTRGGMEVVRRQLGLDGPFISEAGAAVFVPDDYFDFDVRRARELSGYSAIEFALPHRYVTELLHATARRQAIEITTFSELSVEEIALELRLPLLRARLAKLCEYDEPFRAADRSTSSLAQIVAGCPRSATAVSGRLPILSRQRRSGSQRRERMRGGPLSTRPR